MNSQSQPCPAVPDIIARYNPEKPTVLHNGLMLTDGFRMVGSIIIENGLISEVVTQRTPDDAFSPEKYNVIDCQGKFVMPGMIDEHVHFRDPGLTEKGDIATESRAAIAGGVTSFFDMPNTIPQTTTIEAWEDKMSIAAENSAANYAFFMGVSHTNTAEIMRADYTRIPGVKLFLGSTTGGMLVTDTEEIRRLFQEFPHVIACHSESDEIINRNSRQFALKFPDGIPVGLHSAIRSSEACLESTRRIVELARQTDARLHVMHITTADELKLFTPGPLANKRITAETCPHYLLFTEESVAETGGLTKCNPAIKTDADRRALLAAVGDGRVNIIATDHAPHLLSQKLGGDALTTSSGMPSVQFALPLMMQLAGRGYFSLEDVVDRMSTAPADLYAVSRRGRIRRDYMADIVVVNPDADYEIQKENILSPCGWSPYEGMRLKFAVEQTWVNGRLAYYNGTFTNLQTALPVRFDI